MGNTALSFRSTGFQVRPCYIYSFTTSLFIFCFYQGINRTPCKHPKSRESPENWSSNVGRYITLKNPRRFQGPARPCLARIQGSISNLGVSTPAPSRLVNILMFLYSEPSLQIHIWSLNTIEKPSRRKHPTANTLCFIFFYLLLPVSSCCGVMVSSTGRQLETVNPPLIVVIWASNLFLERDKADTITGSRGDAKREKKIGMFEDGSVDVIEPLGG